MLLEIILLIILGLIAYYILRRKGLLPRVPKLTINNHAISTQLAKLEERIKFLEGLEEKIEKLREKQDGIQGNSEKNSIASTLRRFRVPLAY